jgi:flagellar basal body-associated protein FliL
MASKTAKDSAPAGGTKGKGKSKKKLFIILLVVVIGVAGFGYKTMAKKPPGKPPPVTGPVVVESSLTVNLRDGHYLEFTAGLQLAVGRTSTSLNNYTPEIMDILISQASGFTEAGLLAPGGRKALKADILSALNKFWPGAVVAVYFEQFVMQ